jgi:hypothetical protein
MNRGQGKGRRSTTFGEAIQVLKYDYKKVAKL